MYCHPKEIHKTHSHSPGRERANGLAIPRVLLSPFTKFEIPHSLLASVHKGSQHTSAGTHQQMERYQAVVLWRGGSQQGGRVGRKINKVKGGFVGEISGRRRESYPSICKMWYVGTAS